MPEREPKHPSENPTPEDVYGLTRNEQLFDRISDARFREIISQVEALVHEMQVSANNWGEFLFVSTSRVLENECHRLEISYN